MNRLTKGLGLFGALFTKTLKFQDGDATSNEGLLAWNETDGTLDLTMKGNLSLQIGQEEVVRVVNKETTDLAKGEVVYLYGAQGQRPAVKRARADAEATSARTIGIAAEAIVKNQEGFVTVHGLVRDLNTNGFTDGATLYLSEATAGAMRTTPPLTPHHDVFIGICVYAHNNHGIIYVAPVNYPELDELTGVKITNPQDGQVLKYSSALGYWVNANP